MAKKGIKVIDGEETPSVENAEKRTPPPAASRKPRKPLAQTVSKAIPGVLPIKEVAEKLGLPVAWVRKAIKANSIPHIVVSRSIFANPDAVSRALQNATFSGRGYFNGSLIDGGSIAKAVPAEGQIPLFTQPPPAPAAGGTMAEEI